MLCFSEAPYHIALVTGGGSRTAVRQAGPAHGKRQYLSGCFPKGPGRPREQLRALGQGSVCLTAVGGECVLTRDGRPCLVAGFS